VAAVRADLRLVLGLLGVAALAVAAAAPVAPREARRAAADTAAVARQSRNSCVGCHGLQSGATEAGHGFAAWKSSPHARAGVTCEACHGGNPAAQDPTNAHNGVNPSSDPASRVYFTRVPTTCGQCHASEAAYFRTSVHSARLQSDGRGPNCVTCHGSMATRILTPDSALGTCTACHTPGGVAPVGKAREAAQVLALVRAENILYDIVANSAASAHGGGAARARVLLDDAGRHLDAAAEVWHSFRLDSATARLGDARELLAEAWTALGHPKPREARLGRPAGAGRP